MTTSRKPATPKQTAVDTQNNLLRSMGFNGVVVKALLPVNFNDGRPVPEDLTAGARTFFSDFGGGVTESLVYGGWTDPDTGVHYAEQMRSLETFVKLSDWSAKGRRRFDTTVEGWTKTFEQEAIFRQVTPANVAIINNPSKK